MSTNNIVNPPLQLFFMNNTAITLIIIVLLFLKKSQLPMASWVLDVLLIS